MHAYVSRTWLTEHGATMPSGRTYQGPTHWHYTVRTTTGSYSLGGFPSQYLARCAGQAFARQENRRIERT